MKNIINTLISLMILPAIAIADTQFRLNPYLMAATITGDLATEGNRASVDIGLNDAFDKGNGAVGVDFEIRNGSWSLLSQFMYTALSDTLPDVPDLVFDAAKQDWEQITLTEAIGYSIIGEGQDEYLDLVIGGRFASTSTELKLRGGPDDRRRYEDSDSWVDPIVGLYSMMLIGDGTYLQIGGDVGGFDAASKLTWQAITTVDFRLGPQAWLALGYRAISIDYESDDQSYVYNTTMHGPMLGFDFRF